MPGQDEIAPPLSPDVLVRQVDDQGTHVVKHHRKQKYLQLGCQEHFLLSHLDGKTSYQTIVEAFGQRFGESISCQEVGDFIATSERKTPGACPHIATAR